METFVIHVFDTTGPEPEDGAQITTHCGKSLIVRPIKANQQGKLKKCNECFKKSDQFMISHPNAIVHTVFVWECPELEEVTVIISKKDWQFLLRSGGDVTELIRVFSEVELHQEFGDNPEEHIMRVKITPVTS